MIRLTLLYIFLCVSCNNVEKPVESVQFNNDFIHSEVDVGNFHIGLKNSSGECILLYKKNGGKTFNEIDVKMSSPCEFIRSPSEDFKPLFYVYQTGSNKRAVLMVSGGTPDPKIHDSFMPGGCGTALQKVRVFDDYVEIDSRTTGDGGPPVCPSAGMDEVNFAS